MRPTGAGASELDPWRQPDGAIRVVQGIGVAAALASVGAAAGWPFELTSPGLALFGTAGAVTCGASVWLLARALRRLDDQRRESEAATSQSVADLVAANERLQAEIEDRERAEANERQTRAMFEAMFDSCPAGMVLSSLPDIRFVAVNESWLRITGFTREQVMGRTAADVAIIEPHEREALYQETLASGGQRSADFHFRTRDGEPRHGLISIQRLEVNGGSFQVTALMDMTERVRAEADLRDSNHRLETALSELRLAQQRIVEQERVGALGQLASGIAHDFNNALGPILGYSDLLLANPELLTNARGAAEYLQAINTAAQGAAAVVSRLREFYRRRQNGDAHGPAHLPDLIAQAISLTRPRWKDQAQAAGATIEVAVEVEAIPPIEANAAEIRDALVNLILNAVDALPAGGTIALRARSQPNQDGQQEAIVEVTDNGVGMSDAVRRRCLEPFFTTKGDQGTGLGLSIVHGSLRRHGGSLEIDSAVGRGTTVRLRLPARRSEEAAEPLPVPQPLAARPLRILVVDDEPMMRQVVSRFLALDDHRVELASGGHEALGLLQTSPAFDLVITDRAMPEMGGDELAVLVKVLTPGTPVLMLTGFADLMDGADRRPEGVDLVIAKPTTLARLRVAIATLLGDPRPSYDLNAQ
ncbi:MAG: response regulator [Chloroflexota bacterium]